MCSNIAVLFVILFFGACYGQVTTTWNCTTSGNWNNASCWDTGVPTSKDNAVIDGGATPGVTVTVSANASVASLTVQGTITLTISATITVNTFDVYDATVTVTVTGGIAGNDSTAVVTLYGGYVNTVENYGSITATVMANNYDGLLDLETGSWISSLQVSDGVVSFEDGSNAVAVTVTGSSTITFTGPGIIGSTIGTLLDSYGSTYTFTKNAWVTVAKSANITNNGVLTGNGTFVLASTSVSVFQLNIQVNVTVINKGWLQSADCDGYSCIEIDDTSDLINQGILLTVGGIYVNGPGAVLTNDATGVIEQGTSQYPYTCYFTSPYTGSTAGQQGTLNNMGNITCNTLSLAYITVVSTGFINTNNYYFDDQYTYLTISHDMDYLSITGTGTVIFTDGVTVGNLQVIGTYIYLETTGNVTITKYNATAYSYISGVGSNSFFIFETEFNTLGGGYVYIQNVTVVFLPTCNSTSNSYWYLNQGTTIYQQGSFEQLSDDSWTFYDSSVVVYNQGYMQFLDFVLSYDASASTITYGTFINVGILRIDGDLVTYPNFGSCDGSLLILVFGGVNTESFIETENAIAITGQIKVETTSDFIKTFITAYPLIDYSSSVTNVPSDFDSSSLPLYIFYHSYISVSGLPGDDTVFSSLQLCFTTSGYEYIVSSEYASYYSCKTPTQDSTKKGICGGTLPPSTTNIPGVVPPGSSASGMVFSLLLSVIAALFILF